MGGKKSGYEGFFHLSFIVACVTHIDPSLSKFDIKGGIAYYYRCAFTCGGLPILVLLITNKEIQ